MGIITIVQTVKQIHTKDVILVKIGNFYHTYGKDACIISYMFGYQIKKREEIYMCGFSDTCINKVVSTLEKAKINYLIMDRRNNYDVDNVSNNKNLNTYDQVYEKAKGYIKYKNRIEYIYNFMLENIQKDNFKYLIKQIEEVIESEGRKVQNN